MKKNLKTFELVNYWRCFWIMKIKLNFRHNIGVNLKIRGGQISRVLIKPIKQRRV